MNDKVYHGNLLSVEFKNKDFLKKYKILEKRKSTRDNWIHYLLEVPAERLEKIISDIQKNLLPTLYYAHLYDKNGADVIVVFPKKIFRLSHDDEQEWINVKKYMNKYGIKIKRWQDVKPRKFSEEKEYYLNKPLAID